MGKKTVLFVNEIGYLSTGYANYGREVISRLWKTGKYNIVELGIYAQRGDPRLAQIPWQVICNMPEGEQEQAEYNSSILVNAAGKWRFDEVVFHMRPDVVIDIRDPWMCDFEANSPLRNKFSWLYMPTVDSQPQEEEWIAFFKKADQIYTYTDWGLDALKEEGGDYLNLKCSAPAAVDVNVFKPALDKREHRRKLGFSDDLFIVGTINRNQKRKLFPDLMDGFAQFLRLLPTEQAQKCFLYLHTSYPDMGWDIPRLIKEHGLSKHVLTTYKCQACGGWFPSHWQEARTTCVHCGQVAAMPPNTANGIETQELASVANLFDAYVQYAICEGFGIGQVEAAACGVPVFSVDYSAMSDVVRKVGGYPIRVERLFRESETHAYRAYPDNADLAQKLKEYYLLSDEAKLAKQNEARQGVLDHYTWDRTAKIWEKGIDECPETVNRWLDPPEIHNPNISLPQFPNHSSFVRYLYTEVLNRPSEVNSYEAAKMIRNLNIGIKQDARGGCVALSEFCLLGSEPKWTRYTAEDALNEIVERRNYINEWEARRANLIRKPVPQFITNRHMGLTR